MHNFNRRLEAFSRQAVARNNVKLAHDMLDGGILRRKIILERLRKL